MLLEPLWGNKSFLLLALKIPLCCNKVAIVKHEHLLAEQRIWATLNVRLTWHLSSRVPILVSRGGPNWIGMSGLSLVLIPISGLCGQQKWSCSGLEPLLGNYAITFWHGHRNEPLACPLLRLQKPLTSQDSFLSSGITNCRHTKANALLFVQNANLIYPHFIFMRPRLFRVALNPFFSRLACRHRAECK